GVGDAHDAHQERKADQQPIAARQTEESRPLSGGLVAGDLRQVPFAELGAEELGDALGGRASEVRSALQRAGEPGGSLVAGDVPSDVRQIDVAQGYAQLTRYGSAHPRVEQRSVHGGEIELVPG